MRNQKQNENGIQILTIKILFPQNSDPADCIIHLPRADVLLFTKAQLRQRHSAFHLFMSFSRTRRQPCRGERLQKKDFSGKNIAESSIPGGFYWPFLSVLPLASLFLLPILSTLLFFHSRRLESEEKHETWPMFDQMRLYPWLFCLHGFVPGRLKCTRGHSKTSLVLPWSVSPATLAPP